MKAQPRAENKYVEGICPKCGNPIRRKAPADFGVCLCSNPPTDVELKPVISSILEHNEIITQRQVKIQIKRKSEKSSQFNSLTRFRVRQILREQANKISRCEEVYEWASLLTAETRYLNRKDVAEDFYMTEDAKRLIFKIKNSKRALIGVVGLQGIGKTTLLRNLTAYFGEKALFFPWDKDWKQRLEELNASLRLEYEDIEAFLCYEFRYVFIDFHDYDKKKRGEMSKDLTDFSELWRKCTAYGEKMPTFVVGIQKEMFKGHFIYGKMDIVELSPLKPEELVNAYKQKWGSVEPFTEDALLLIAELSRGIFRRFLKYVQKCIERTVLENQFNSLPISSDFVKQTITVDLLVKDMDLELSDIFTNKEQKTIAVKLLNCIREAKEINQTRLAELLEVSNMTISRIVAKLEANGYIKRKRGKHAEWLISLS